MHQFVGQICHGEAVYVGKYRRVLTCYENKSLSDDIDPMLALQGLSWLTRTAIRYATVVVR